MISRRQLIAGMAAAGIANAHRQIAGRELRAPVCRSLGCAVEPRTPFLLGLPSDEAAGRGIGSTKTQGNELSADTIAFVSWRASSPGWRPSE